MLTNDVHGLAQQEIIHVENSRGPLLCYVLYQLLAAPHHMPKSHPEKRIRAMFPYSLAAADLFGQLICDKQGFSTSL